MGESEVMMKRFEDLVNLGAKIQILEATIVDKNAKIEMLLGSLMEKDKLTDNYLRNLQQNEQQIADMDKSLAISWAWDGKLPLPENQDTTEHLDSLAPWNYCQFIGDPPKEYSSWDAFMRAKEKKNVQIKAIGDWKQDLSDAMRLQAYEEKAGDLSNFIMENFKDELSKKEDAIECAVRLLGRYAKYGLSADNVEKESLRCYKREIEKLTSFLSRNFIGELNRKDINFEGIVDCAIRLLNEHINVRVSLSELKMLVKEAYQKAKIEE